MTPLNPDTYYTQAQLTVQRHMAEALLRVAERDGKLDHPAVAVARANLQFIERTEHANAA